MLELFRVLAIVLIVMHGLTHLVYPAAAWTSVRTGFGEGAWILPGDFTIRSPLGKLWGIGGVLVLALFLLGALGLLIREPGWVGPTNLAVFLSFGVAVPWWRQSPRSIGVWQVFANLALMFLLALPLSEEIVLA